MKGIIRWASSFIVFAALALGSFASAPAATGVRIGISSSDAAAVPLYAERTGVFARHGLAATVRTGMQGVDVLAGLRDGTIDIGFANTLSTASAIHSGQHVVMLAPGAFYLSAHPVTVLVQAPSSTFRTGKDLDGKTIASPSGHRDLGAITNAAWIDQHGGDSKTVTFVTGIKLHDVGAALAAHKVDAAELTEPELSAQIRSGQVKLLAPTLDAVGNGFIIGGFVATRAWVNAHPAAAREFIAAMAETASWANAHRGVTAPIIAKELHVSPAVVTSMVRATYAIKLTTAELQPVLNVGAKYGVIPPMRATALFDPSL